MRPAAADEQLSYSNSLKQAVLFVFAVAFSTVDFRRWFYLHDYWYLLKSWHHQKSITTYVVSAVPQNKGVPSKTTKRFAHDCYSFHFLLEYYSCYCVSTMIVRPFLSRRDDVSDTLHLTILFESNADVAAPISNCVSHRYPQRILRSLLF